MLLESRLANRLPSMYSSFIFIICWQSTAGNIGHNQVFVLKVQILDRVPKIEQVTLKHVSAGTCHCPLVSWCTNIVLITVTCYIYALSFLPYSIFTLSGWIRSLAKKVQLYMQNCVSDSISSLVLILPGQKFWKHRISV